MITLKEFADRIIEPMVKALEQREGKTREELLREYEAKLRPVRKILKRFRLESDR
jgi:hypothetical protein